MVRNETWCLDNLYTLLPAEAQESLSKIAPQLTLNRADKWIWSPSATGCYTVRNGGTLLHEVWKAPPTGKIKLNTYGSWREPGAFIGGGGLLRGADGGWLHGFWSCGQGQSAFMAELEALRDGLQMAWNSGYKDIVAEVDSRETLHVLRDAASHAFCPVLSEVVKLLSYQWRVDLQWIPRECNATADCLAKLGLDGGILGISYFERPPVEVEPLLLRDSFSAF
ncbi:uncharacterized protein LOC130728390 [Lotus japonicus]|uniref:uncharacterized protein LOC130728390 n=1 Tax=Lotus japonicus TaxID=34305 RepID=UPI002583120A|nr:uncharacterized protein LOC130728390 [Lotus japonicus]